MTILSANALPAFYARLHDWYETHGRHDLPWRNTSDAYAIYISETMLQQTQVATVLERFYHPFLKRFPALSDLAAATQEEVLSAWQGLGYYSRARNLHEAARRAGPSLPQNAEGLMGLPGIGRNTAHAVAAFAYREAVPVLEANVKRVVARIFALDKPTQAQLWDAATLLLNRAEPFHYNQAMMDLGALICTPRAPACALCPASGICEGQRDPLAYPAKTPKKATPVRRKSILLLRNARGQIYATPRAGRFLGGLYHFVEMEKGDASVIEGKKYSLQDGEPLGKVRQQYSHFLLDACVYLLRAGDSCGSHWHDGQTLRLLPMSGAELKILQLLDARKADISEG